MSSLTRFQDTERLAKEVDLFARRLDELRLAYDQYFNGVVREEPSKLREEVFGYVRKYSGTGVQNAGIRFKLQQIIAKYNTYITLWDRVLREIEEGRYRRDLFRLNIKKKFEERAEKSPQKPATTTSIGSHGLGQKTDPYEKLYDQYVQAKRSCKEPLDGLTLDNFKKNLTGQIQKLQPQLQGKKLRFQVAIENGKAKIKTLIADNKK